MAFMTSEGCYAALGASGGLGDWQMRFEAAPFGVCKVLWYVFLMLGILPSEYLRTPFQTVS